jgi:two-component system LytT family sensor kinase
MFLIWTGIGVLTSLRYALQFPSKPGVLDLSKLLALCAGYYPWIALTPAVFRIEKRFPLGTRSWARNLTILALISVPVCLLVSPLMMGLLVAVSNAFHDRTLLTKLPWYFSFPEAETIFWLSVAGGYFIRTLSQLREQERMAARLALEKSQLEAGLNQAQLDVLRARLNPHFLFNCLQNISVMAKQDSRTASRMLTRLGDLLRVVLRQDSQPESTLQEEIELTHDYVELEQMRFGDRLQVHFEIAPAVQLAMVPCFLLQPLVENAIVHGLRGVQKTGFITVSAANQGGELVLAVTDNGIGLPTEDPAKMKIGIGLQSTRERLERMYPESHTFSIHKTAEGGTEVRITIPLRLADYEDRSSGDE